MCPATARARGDESRRRPQKEDSHDVVAYCGLLRLSNDVVPQQAAIRVAAAEGGQLRRRRRPRQRHPLLRLQGPPGRRDCVVLLNHIVIML